ncbi:PREDICTED: uncharacterized protein LOC106785714 [Polistes canadensis]|uniref:uncharacterized protein LOC106785714 n=1 Tax=Polistes canadensis TaxID=91411 RepID=UPI000718F050|nr:PREDICTED: uncharacterized protein LOC106785714 [Polistes canadensis]
MDFFEQRYYVLNKRLMSYFGMWPLDNSIRNWKGLTDVKEMAILSTYSESGRKLTIWYTLYISLTTTLYLSIPLSPVVLNIVSPSNVSRKMELLFCTEFFVAEEIYFNEILFYDYAITLLVIAVLIATDTLYIVYSEHACGIFAILSYRLNNVGKCKNIDERYDNNVFNKKKYHNYDEKQDEENCQELSFCVKRHKYAIEYVELLQKCYAESLMALLLLNVIGISITGVQTIINIHSLSNVFRFGFLTLGEAFHLFFLTLPGQRIIDHSLKVFEDCYESYWYKLSTKGRKTLGLILLRSMTPCQLMAGGLYSMTLENFVSVEERVSIYFVALTYIILPLTPKILDIVIPLNETRPIKFIFYAEYNVDEKKYFWYILMHGYAVSAASISILIATDTLIVRYVQHAVAVFNVIGYRLRNLKKCVKKDNGSNNNISINDKIHCHIINCMKQHQNILRFTDLLESTYSHQIFFEIFINMLLMSITGVQTVMKLGEPDEVIRLGFFCIGQAIHLYFVNIPGQKLIDHSVLLTDSAYFGEWYDVPPKSRKLLSMIILRSSKPCKLTGGKVLVLSIEKFKNVLRASISYFTVLASLKK